MNKLSLEKRIQIVSMLVEGNSLRSITRIADVSINTVTKLLVDLGKACSEYQDKALRNLNCKRIQVDEIWSFCYSKQKNVPHEMKGTFGYGDVWTWTALDADTKLVPCWSIGYRNADDASIFIDDLASRLSSKIQLTSDGHKAYLSPIEDAFGCDIDYAMLVKLYGKSPEEEKRYSPASCVGINKMIVTGTPDAKHISTSYVERQNLTMRMGMRRFTRLTNGFSKKVENHGHAIALHFMYYNFVRIHKTLKTSPAMAAGVSERLWSIKHLLDLLK